VGVFDFIDHGDVFQLDVQELIYAFQRSFDGDIVLELDGDFVVDQGLEKASQFMVSLGFQRASEIEGYLKKSMARDYTSALTE
jgi:hypothetical protein